VVSQAVHKILRQLLNWRGKENPGINLSVNKLQPMPTTFGVISTTEANLLRYGKRNVGKINEIGQE
jgi:hypothetical protein